MKKQNNIISNQTMIKSLERDIAKHFGIEYTFKIIPNFFIVLIRLKLKDIESLKKF
jgi:hypothetical protein